MQVRQAGTATVYDKKFLPKQKLFAECAAPEVLFSGAWGCGKTRILCEKVLLLCMYFPGNRVGVFRKTAKSVRATTIRKLLEPDGDLPPVIPPRLIQQHHKRDSIITLRTNPPSEIMYGGMDQRGADGEAWFNSLDFGAIAVDQAEELSDDDLSLLEGRLRHPAQPVQQLLLVCNPKGRSHHLYKRFFVEKSNARVVIQSNTYDNTFLPRSYLHRLARFTGPFFDRFVLGKWVDLEGLVYPNFDPLVHVLDRMPLPDTWDRFWTVDFGYTAPYCAQLWAVKDEYPEDWPHRRIKGVPKGSMIMTDEIYHTRRIVAHHAMRMRRIADKRIAPFAVCDWDAEDRATLMEEGHYSTIQAFKDIQSGLQYMTFRLGNYEDPNTGEYVAPTMYFLDGALDERDNSLTIDPITGKEKHAPVCTVDEFGYYSWPVDRTGNPKKSEIPADEFNHGMDAGRYGVAHLDGSNWCETRIT